MNRNQFNHEVHKVHEVKPKYIFGLRKNNIQNFVYFVNFVVKKILMEKDLA